MAAGRFAQSVGATTSARSPRDICSAAGRTMQDCQIGNAIANGYLSGEACIPAKAVWHLSHHCLGTSTTDDYYGYGK